MAGKTGVWTRVAAVDEVQVGACRPVRLDGRRVALFRTGAGRFHAIEDSCPHMGLPIADGRFDGTVVRCRHHGVTIDVQTGRSPHITAFWVDVFPLKIDKGAVWLKAPAADQSSRRRSPRA